jgi:general secretion pathway protein A
MYEAYWQLEAKPFEPLAGAGGYYPSETHQGALLKLRYAVENRRGAAVLVGPSGTGKTMLVQMLREQLPENWTPFVHLVFPKLNSRELLTYIADELGAPAAEGGQPGLDQIVRRIERFVAENTRQGQHAVVVIDEAQVLADSETMETVRMLLNFADGDQPGLTLLLAGQPSLLPALTRMTTLDDRVGVKTILQPFSLEESVSYITHRLTHAGAGRAIFDDSAVEALHQFGHGIPRQINRLADLALLIGFAEELPRLSAEHIAAVSEELITVA